MELTTQQRKEDKKTPLKFHHGNSLFHLAGTYPTLQDVILEMIQNALDAWAVSIKINIDYRKRLITIQDDGNGVTEEKFIKALSSIAQSIKKDDEMGRFGLGLISPLGKCSSFSLMSVAKEEKIWRRWLFDCGQIQVQYEVPEIPYKIIPNVFFCRDPKKIGKKGNVRHVPWRTEVRINEFTKDRMVSGVNLEDLCNEVVSRYNIVLGRNKATVEILIVRENGDEERHKVKETVFKGEKIEQFILSGDLCGKVIFDLAVAPVKVGKRRGEVFFGETKDNYRLTMRQFLQSTAGIIPAEISEAFYAGIFAGNIVGESIELHASRKSFVKNDALVDFCIIIEQWYKEIGSAYVDSIKTEQQNIRWANIGAKALSLIGNCVKELGLKDLFEGISFRGGGLISTEPNPEGDAQLGTEKMTKKRELSQGTKSDQKKTDAIKNKTRVQVRAKNVGLQFDFSEMPGDSAVYRFDASRGVLEFNVRHPQWVACDRLESTLREFQFQVAVQAIITHAFVRIHPTQRALIEKMFSEHLKTVTYNIINGRRR